MSDRQTNRASPDSDQDDEVYVKNEEGEVRMVSRSGKNESYQGGELIVNPRVYGLLLIIGAVLLIVGRSALSMVGIGLLVIGAFIGVIDVASGA